MSERVWQLQDAKNKFSELVERAVNGEPQVVTKHGKRTAVLMSADEYARLKGRSTGIQPADFVQQLNHPRQSRGLIPVSPSKGPIQEPPEGGWPMSPNRS